MEIDDRHETTLGTPEFTRPTTPLEPEHETCPPSASPDYENVSTDQEPPPPGRYEPPDNEFGRNNAAPPCAPAPAPAPVLATSSVLVISPVIQDDSQNILAAQNNTPSILVTTTVSDDPPSCAMKASMIASTSENSADPLVSDLVPAVNLHNRTDSQDIPNVPSTSSTSKKTTKKPQGKKPTQAQMEKVTAR